MMMLMLTSAQQHHQELSASEESKVFNNLQTFLRTFGTHREEVQGRVTLLATAGKTPHLQCYNLNGVFTVLTTGGN
jgi:hypothetical protein